MRPWTTERRWRCTWQRDGARWSKSTGSPRKKWENQTVLIVGDVLQRPRETWEGSRGPPVPSI